MRPQAPGALASLQTEAGQDAVALAQEEYPVEAAQAPRQRQGRRAAEPRVANFQASAAGQGSGRSDACSSASMRG